MHIDDLPNQHLQPEEIAEMGAAPGEMSLEESLDSDPAFAPAFSGERDTAPATEEVAAEGEEGEEAEVPPSNEPIEYRDLDATQLQSAVESVLFMNHKPVTLAKLRELINPAISEEDYRTAVSNIMASYFDETKGIELLEVANGYQFRTKTDNKDIIRRMYQISPMKLTNAMLEVLAIVAYNQPCVREDIDKIRGVDSSHLLRMLLDKKMLRIAGKSDDVGKPMIYGTSKEFLELFGLRDLSSLPSLREIEDMLPQSEVGGESSEELLLAQEMEGIVTESKPLEFNDLELADLDRDEAQKIQNNEELQSQENSRGSQESNGSPEAGTEAGSADHDIEAEAFGRIPFGPKGNA